MVLSINAKGIVGFSRYNPSLPRALNINSSYSLPYITYYVSSENLALNK